MSRSTVDRLPGPIAKALRRIKRFSEGGGHHSHLERYDNMVQLLEQRVVRDFVQQVDQMRVDLLHRQDALMRMIDQRLSRIEQEYEGRRDDNLAGMIQNAGNEIADRQDNMLMLIEQQMIQAIHDLKIDTHQQVETRLKNQNAGMLDDAAYKRLQDSIHNNADKSEHYKDLIKRFLPRVSMDNLAFDIGCGSGSFLEALRDNGWYGIGIDTNEESVSLCRQKGLDIKHGDAIDILQQSESESCNAIVALHVVEHFPDHAFFEFVKQSLRVLKPGGVLVLETPKIASISTLTEYYFIDPTHQSPRHHLLYKFVCADLGFDHVLVEDCTQFPHGKLAIDRLSTLGAALQPDSALPSEATDNDSNQDSSQMASAFSQISANFKAIDESIYIPRDVLIVAAKGPVSPAKDETRP